MSALVLAADVIVRYGDGAVALTGWGWIAVVAFGMWGFSR